MLGVAKLMGTEGHLEGLGGILDGRDVPEGLGEPLRHEIVERLLLDRNQVGELHNLRYVPEADPLTVRARWDRSDLEITHQAIPPSSIEKWRIICSVLIYCTKDKSVNERR